MGACAFAVEFLFWDCLLGAFGKNLYHFGFAKLLLLVVFIHRLVTHTVLLFWHCQQLSVRLFPHCPLAAAMMNLHDDYSLRHWLCMSGTAIVQTWLLRFVYRSDTSAKPTILVRVEEQDRILAIHHLNWTARNLCRVFLNPFSVIYHVTITLSATVSTHHAHSWNLIVSFDAYLD